MRYETDLGVREVVGLETHLVLRTQLSAGASSIIVYLPASPAYLMNWTARETNTTCARHTLRSCPTKAVI